MPGGTAHAAKADVQADALRKGEGGVLGLLHVG